MCAEPGIGTIVLVYASGAHVPGLVLSYHSAIVNSSLSNISNRTVCPGPDRTAVGAGTCGASLPDTVIYYITAASGLSCSIAYGPGI